MRWVSWFLGHFNAQTPPQNTPFLALLQRNAKAEYANYNNINALHFCILQFENVEECILNQIIKKPLKFSDFLIVVFTTNHLPMQKNYSPTQNINLAT